MDVSGDYLRVGTGLAVASTLESDIAGVSSVKPQVPDDRPKKSSLGVLSGSCVGCSLVFFSLLFHMDPWLILI